MMACHGGGCVPAACLAVPTSTPVAPRSKRSEDTFGTGEVDLERQRERRHDRPIQPRYLSARFLSVDRHIALECPLNVLCGTGRARDEIAARSTR
jgi:hypothetical protein